MTGLRPRVMPASQWPEIEPLWRAVFEQSDARSIFTGPEWVGAWLGTFGRELGAEIVVCETGHEIAAASVIVERPRALPRVPLHRIYFHTTGEAPPDSPVAEHTCIISRPDAREAAVTLIGQLLRDRAWDEVVLHGATERTITELTAAVADGTLDVEWRPTYLVDLAELRTKGAAYESVLTSNARAQLKRSRTLYGERGALVLHQAQTAADARALFDELVAINQKHHDADRRSVFHSDKWRAFHHLLIDRAFVRGVVQLSTVKAGTSLIGVLYNLVDRGTMSFYQSAFVYEDDNRLKPGYVAHALAIEAALDAGLDTYDFLASDSPAGSRYKKSMAMRSDRLAWAVLRRKTIPTLVVGGLRKARARLS